MAIDGGTIAAIITGILALVGGLATAWLSGWNENRKERRQNLKEIGLHAMPLVIAAWDLHNWFYDILDGHNYSRIRCDAYSEGWDSRYTSYLIGRYLTTVHIIGLKTQYFSFVDDAKIEKLKIGLWKIQDEFATMNHEDRTSLAMRWFEGDMQTVQEHMTVPGNDGDDDTSGDLRIMSFVEFQKNYGSGLNLHGVTGWYENEFQRIIYRRFKREYASVPERCPAPRNTTFEEELQAWEHEYDVQGRIVVPDHRIRRLQHMLADIVELADGLSFTRLRRPVRRWDPSITGDREAWVPCDCWWAICKPDMTNKSFWWRPNDVQDSVKGFSDSMAVRRHDSMPLEKHAREGTATV